jgi:hypothetical protein
MSTPCSVHNEKASPPPIDGASSAIAQQGTYEATQSGGIQETTLAEIGPARYTTAAQHGDGLPAGRGGLFDAEVGEAWW